MATYRVFVERHYIDVCFFDVKADNPNKARNIAVKAAYQLRPDSRAKASDNGWNAQDKPVTIAKLGSAATSFPVKLFLKAGTSEAYIDASEA